jgi:transcriptional regulator with XRE-family HTH domain
MTVQRDYDKLLQCIAYNIRRLRRSRDLTQEDMIDFGFNYRHYQKLESGSYSPNLRTLHRLAIVFKTNITEFFTIEAHK